MQLFKHLLRFPRAVAIGQILSRNASILSALETSPVLVSSNKDVYTNLALEHWLYTNLTFAGSNVKKVGSVATDNSRILQSPVVLIWTDEPCVVIGRHQNPWVESTLGFINRSSLKLARRHSGGGCVYHDENNINISIIGNRNTFENRQGNLKFLAKILKEKYDIGCEPTKRHDLVHSDSGLKISGSAAKLGRFNCYHHFTVLVNTDKEALYTSIRQIQQDFIHTNSSLSTRTKVVNLNELKANLKVEQVILDLANAYCKLYNDPDVKQPARKDSIQGDEQDFLSLKKYRDQLGSWEWIYGKTPKFKLERSFTLIESGQEKQVQFVVQVNKGLFEGIEIETNLSSCKNPVENFKNLIGTKFTYKEAMTNAAKLLQVDEKSLANANISIGTEKLFATFLLRIIYESNF